jgi:hypothetical protein
MTYILWDDPFFVDPTTGVAYDTYQAGTIPVPKYGNYGGAFSDPLSFPSIKGPVDASDGFYQVHDSESELAGSNEMLQVAADIKLITSLTFDDSSYSADPEATLYDGIVTAGLIGRLAINDELGLVGPGLLSSALVDAAQDIEFGLDHLPKPELNVALDAFFEQSGKHTFTFSFDITTQSFGEELVEAVVIQAVAGAINEKNDPIVDTGLFDNLFAGGGGTSEYDFVYNFKTHDLDLISI